MFLSERLTLAIVVFVSFLPSAARRAGAEEPVFVSFSFSEPSIARRFGNAQAVTEQDVTTWLVARFDRTFPYWNYRPATPADYPRLTVAVKRSQQDWVIALTLEIAPGGVPSYARSVTWLNGAELQRIGMPLPAQIVTMIQKTIDEQVLGVQSHELFKALQAVPLGRDARLQSPATRAVLPLEWTRHRRLGLSGFELHYSTPNGVAIVSCTGVGATMSYPAPPPASGLVVQLQQLTLGGTSLDVQNGLGALSGLTPYAVFLTRFDARGDSLMLGGADIGIPSVVPPR